MTETTSIRPGEVLAAASLQSFLASQGIEGELSVSQFPAGSSNLTYLVTVGGQDYVLRRPPFGNTVKTAHDMRREFDVLSHLSDVYPPAPRPVLFCDYESVIGSKFYLMERRHGLIIRSSIPDQALQVPSDSAAVCKAFIENLAALHSIDYEAAGLGSLGHPAGYNRRQVEGWKTRYSAAKTHESRELESVIHWLTSNIPAESGATLIHNDYKFDNIMLDRRDLTRVIAVLDWEMVTIGDPLMDLGTTLGYWMSADAGEAMLSMPFNPRVLMENISRAQLVDMYAKASGREPSNILFYYVFGTFKVAVIAQQIFARYVRGKTKDARFASFDRFVEALGVIASTAIERGTI
jgi:aminoglycoside phosphotransferase (APT) family kinase protein